MPLAVEDARGRRRRNRKRGLPLGRDAPERGHIEMIVVVVALQHQIDRGKLIEIDAGGAMARRSNPGKRAGAMRPDGIAKDVQAFQLD